MDGHLCLLDHLDYTSNDDQSIIVVPSMLMVMMALVAIAAVTSFLWDGYVLATLAA